jgi:hypothetical protein
MLSARPRPGRGPVKRVAAGRLNMQYYERLSMTAIIVLVGRIPRCGAGPFEWIATALR